MPPPARQNGPGLIGPQKVRLVILFGPKVQGAPADVAGYRRVVRGARFKEREPWFAVDGLRLYLDTPREFESPLLHITLSKERHQTATGPCRGSA